MFWGEFWNNRERLEAQYADVNWVDASGMTPQNLKREFDELEAKLQSEHVAKASVKARMFAFVMDNAQLAIEPCELIQDHIRHEFLIQEQRQRWVNMQMQGDLAQSAKDNNRLYELGVGDIHPDFGHTAPDWYDIMALGFPGLLKRIRAAWEEKRAYGKLTDEENTFYSACDEVYSAAIRYLRRLAALCNERSLGEENAKNRQRLEYCACDLYELSEHEPRTLHQALQLAYVYHILQEEIEGERLRSLGGLDRIYARFMRADLDAGRLRIDDITELWQDIFQKFHALTGDRFFGEPMYLGGTLPDGSCAVNEFSYVILRAYDALKVANPKFHIRVSKNTPKDFVLDVLDCVRRGNSSFVFISDECAVPMMMDCGATLEEAREYVPIGCYEPGILGREVACTGNGGLSLPKALELTLNNGKDPISGAMIGAQTGELVEFDTFDKLMEAVKRQIYCLAGKIMHVICEYEKRYMEMNPSPLFSGTLRECVADGKDAYAGGAKYNNSSLSGYGNATLADSLAMIRKYVYERSEFSLAQLNDMLHCNWVGHGRTRVILHADINKWGNNRPSPDLICKELCEDFADYVNSTPNGRGGHFKAALFSIDFNYYFGKHLGASADGRYAGEIISRNTGAASTMDRNGVTALIESVTRLDNGKFHNGSVLDIMLHPTAVSGADGLEAFYTLLDTYFARGGFAIHGNVMDSAILRDAQNNPQNYQNLQVRVCGWNVYFVNLSKEEQDEFIARAED